MTLTKPILQTSVAFDKNDGNTFIFTSNGGNQVVKNRLTIRDNVTNVVVYQKIVESFKFTHELDEVNNLVNGRYYNAYINTYDINGNISDNSNLIQFYCYTTPTLTFVNIPLDGIINNSSYEFEIEYEQLENEQLDSIIVELYDISGVLVKKSDKIYSQEIPPLILKYLLTGIEDGNAYRIRAIGNTINGTIIESDYEIFRVEYVTPIIYNLLEVENKCKEGYITLKSNIQVVVGKLSEGAFYTKDGYLDISDYGDSVLWDSGFSLNDLTETLGIWMRPTQIANFVSMFKDDLNKYSLNLVREIPYGETVVKDYFEIVGYKNGQKFIYNYSNFVDTLNNMSKILVWLERDGKNMTLTLDIISLEDSYIEWNGDSNVEYGLITNIEYINSIHKSGEYKDIIASSEQIGAITNVEFKTGRYDHMALWEEYKSVSEEKPTKEHWDSTTVMICDFNNNVNAGNIDFALTTIKGLRFKRREKGTYDWVTIMDTDVISVEDFDITSIDSFAPSGVHFEYAIVPVLYGNIEGDYIIKEVYSDFNNVFISDIDEIFKINSNATIQKTRVKQKGVLQPIGTRTPFIINNSNENYVSGSVSGRLLGSFEQTFKVDGKEINRQGEAFTDFLTNGKTKILKDWNGEIVLCEIVENISYTQNLVDSVVTISFNFIEQGKYNNQTDLKDYGMIKRR